jgi:hypothetical protein
VQDQLTEHAARVLQGTPGRTMDAGTLYQRVSQGTGLPCGISLFLDRLAARPDRFCVLREPGALGDAAVWTEGERAAYARLLRGPSARDLPIVTLAEPDGSDAEWDLPVEGGAGLEEVHRSVSALLRGLAGDPQLLSDVGSALAGLEACGHLGARPHPSAPGDPGGSGAVP